MGVMSSSEAIGKETPAGEGELDNLALLTQAELWDKGLAHFDLPSKIEEMIGGVPVITGDDLPRLEYTASHEAVRAVDPEAAEVLGLKGPLTIISYEEYYTRTQDGELVCSKPLISFAVAKDPGSHEDDNHESLFVYQDDDTGAMTSSRMSEADFGSGPVKNFMTRAEFKALFSIVRKLEDIKAFDERVAAGIDINP